MTFHDRLAELDALHAAARPGPWVSTSNIESFEDDLDSIIALHNAWPEVREYIRELEARIRAREAIQRAMGGR